MTTELNSLIGIQHREIEPTPQRELVICSLGRGGLIADRIQAVATHKYTNIELIDPQRPIGIDDLRVIYADIPDDRLIRKQLVSWLFRTTEGRPLRNQEDYIYGGHGINLLNNDLTRIAALKSRALFPFLLDAYRVGKPFVKCDVISRDTGQLLKASGSDMYIYQSHPGNEQYDQVAQFRDLFDARYALIGTTFLVISGRFPTKTPLDIYRSMEILHGLAYNLHFGPDTIPPDMDLQVYQRFYLAAFRVSHDIWEFEEVLPYARTANVPGGVNWDDYRMNDCLEFLVFPSSQQPYIEMPNAQSALAEIPLIDSLKDDMWHRLSNPKGLPQFEAHPEAFTAIRQGMPPAECIRDLFKEIHTT